MERAIFGQITFSNSWSLGKFPSNNTNVFLISAQTAVFRVFSFELFFKTHWIVFWIDLHIVTCSIMDCLGMMWPMVDLIFRTEAEKGLVLVPPFHIALDTTPSGGQIIHGPPACQGHSSPFYHLTSDPPLMHSLHSRWSTFYPSPGVPWVTASVEGYGRRVLFSLKFLWCSGQI